MIRTISLLISPELASRINWSFETVIQKGKLVISSDCKTPLLFSLHSVNRTDPMPSIAKFSGLDVLPHNLPIFGTWYSTRVELSVSKYAIAFPSCSLNQILSSNAIFQ